MVKYVIRIRSIDEMGAERHGKHIWNMSNKTIGLYVINNIYWNIYHMKHM